MLTKSQWRMMTREWLDDPSARRWSDARIDLAIQLATDDLWTDCLDVAPLLTSQLHTITSLVSPGYIDLRLTTQGGQLTQRFYRIQQVVRGGRTYRTIDSRDVLIEANKVVNTGGTDFGYYVIGDQLWLFPLDTTTDVELRYSFKPTPFTSLTDGMNVPFPEGNESAAILLASATTMAKGGAEDVGQLMALARDARERLMASIRRQYHGMTVPFTTQSAIEFGGT